jgi:hypothetical protein
MQARHYSARTYRYQYTGWRQHGFPNRSKPQTHLHVCQLRVHAQCQVAGQRPWRGGPRHQVAALDGSASSSSTRRLDGEGHLAAASSSSSNIVSPQTLQWLQKCTRNQAANLQVATCQRQSTISRLVVTA